MATAFPPLAKEELRLGVEVPHNPAVVRVDVFYPFNNRAPHGTVLISLTGLPNATLLFNEITLLFNEIGEVKARMDQFGSEQRATPGRVVTGVRGLLDSRGIAGGNISMDDLNSAIRNQVDGSLERSDMLRELRSHVLRLVEGSATQQATRGNEADDRQDEGTSSRDLYEWTDHPEKLRKKLPEDFDLRRLQNTSPLTIWGMWHRGLTGHRFALKEVAYGDVPKHKYLLDQQQVEKHGEAGARQRRFAADRTLFGKLRSLCFQLDSAAGIDTQAEPPPSYQELARLYSSQESAVRNLLPRPKTQKNRRRRVSELTWVTVHAYAQKRRRLAPAENEQAGAE